MADRVNHYEIVLSFRGKTDPALLDRVVGQLATLDGAEVTDARQIEALGMTAKDAFFTVMLSLPTSIAANFATDAIREALERDDATAQVQVDDVTLLEEPPTPPDAPDPVAIVPPGRRGEQD